MVEPMRIRPHTSPSSPTHSLSSSSSSDFEFRICSSPPDKCSAASLSLCPADDLFYKGNLLPLHLSPRISMVRTLLASASGSSASDATTSASRDSSGSSSSSDAALFGDYKFDSSRPSSAADLEHEFLKPPLNRKSFSLAKFSFLRKKEPRPTSASSSAKRLRDSAREVFEKYLKKVRPLYEKISQKQKSDRSARPGMDRGLYANSFLGTPRYARRRGVVGSCPSSIRSSPCHSGLLTRSNYPVSARTSHDSSMEELQSAIQGAIAHCKNSLLQNKTNPTVENSLFQST